MKKVLRVRIQKREEEYVITNIATGETLHQFKTHDDLDAALLLLKKINRLKTIGEKPIYENHIIYGVSAWSFHQSRLFWENIRYFIVYESLIKTFFESNYVVVAEEGVEESLFRALRESGIQIEASSSPLLKKSFSKIKVLVSNFVLGLFARISGYVALVYAKLAKRNILTYSPDKFDRKSGGDFRMREIYKFFNKHKVPFIEVFHTNLGSVFARNIFQRARPAFFLEFLPLRSFVSLRQNAPAMYALSEFPPHQHKYIQSLVVKFDQKAKTSVAKVIALRRIIKFLGIKKLVTIDDMRDSQEIITACRSLGVRSYGFQHGHVNKYHTGLMNYEIPPNLSAPFDELFMWNKYWRDMLVSNSTMYTNQNVTIGGYLRPPKDIEGVSSKRKIPRTPAELSILIANDTWAPREEVRFFLKRFLDMGCTLYLSVRPDISVEKQLSDFGLGNHPNVFMCKGADPVIIRKVDCVAGVYSTYLYEMMYYDLPVLALATSFTFGDDLAKDNLAYRLERNFEFDEIQKYLSQATSKKDIIWENQTISVEKSLEKIFS